MNSSSFFYYIPAFLRFLIFEQLVPVLIVQVFSHVYAVSSNKISLFLLGSSVPSVDHQIEVYLAMVNCNLTLIFALKVLTAIAMINR